MDVVGGSVASLCEAYRETVRKDSSGCKVNLLFDRENEEIAVESPYTHTNLRVVIKKPAPLWIRIPSWVDTGRISVRGTGQTPRHTNGYLFIAQPACRQWITVDFPLPEREIVLKHAVHNIRVRLKGDEITAMDNFGQDLTFFNPIE